MSFRSDYRTTYESDNEDALAFMNIGDMAHLSDLSDDEEEF